MVRLFSLSLLTVLAGAAVAGSSEQQVLTNPSTRFGGKWSYTDCGSATDLIQLNSLTVFPDPPQPGRDLTVTVNATAVDVIEEGAYAKVSVKIGLIKLLDKEFDLCEEAQKADITVQCPVQEGTYEVKHTVKLPIEIPRAKFNVDIKGFTKDEDNLVCLKLLVDFGLF